VLKTDIESELLPTIGNSDRLIVNELVRMPSIWFSGRGKGHSHGDAKAGARELRLTVTDNGKGRSRRRYGLAVSCRTASPQQLVPVERRATARVHTFT